MTKQVHYVVVVDLETKTFWPDDETFIARFAENEGTWNTETEQWEPTTWEDNLAGLEILNWAKTWEGKEND